jgi:hypothetical protein
MLTPASTDAVNRAPNTSYSEVTGITQTARNFGASLGLAVLGAILVSHAETNVTGALTKAGVPRGIAHRVAASFGLGAPGVRSSSAQPHTLVHDVQLVFAHSTQTVFYIMAGVMAATFLVSVRWVLRGVIEPVREGEAADIPPASSSSQRTLRRTAGRSPDDRSTTHAPIALSSASAAQVVTKLSPHSVADTVVRLSEIVAARGMKLFAVIDHSGEAEAAGLGCSYGRTRSRPRSATPLQPRSPPATTSATSSPPGSPQSKC